LSLVYSLEFEIMFSLKLICQEFFVQILVGNNVKLKSQGLEIVLTGDFRIGNCI